MAYKSQYTGAEVDRAVGSLLGNEYDNNAYPGCRMIGITQDLRQDIDQVTIPGLYTVFFYYNGPGELASINPAPIRMRVYWEGDKLIQWILYHTNVYFRDLMTTKVWTKVELAAKEIDIIDNLFSDRQDAALSANMGRFLKEYIDGRQIGGQNLILNSSFSVPYFDNGTGWMWTNGLRGEGTEIDNDTIIRTQGKEILKPVIITNASNSASMPFVTDPSTMPYAYNNACTYTASVYVGNVKNMSNIDSRTGKKYVDVSLQIALCNEFGTQYLDQSQPTVIRIDESEVDSNGNLKPIRIINTFNNTGDINSRLTVIISLLSPGKVSIYAPKLEFGDYATAWNQSVAEQYEEFCNAKTFYGVGIEKATQTKPLKQQSGYRYDTTSGKFVIDQLAVGGGGGFIKGSTAPTEKQCLWFDTSTYDGYLRYNDGTNWTLLPISSIISSTTAPADTSKWWLDLNSENDIIAATLKYYDKNRKIWRMPLTSPAKCYVIQATAPDNQSLIWIHSETHIPRVYDETTREWIIMHAAWGENRPTT